MAKKKKTTPETETKKDPLTPQERTKAYRERLKASGKSEVLITLPNSVIKRLDKLCESSNKTRSDLIQGLIKGTGK